MSATPQTTATIDLSREDILKLLQLMTVMDSVAKCLICARSADMHPTEFVVKPTCEPSCLAERVRQAGRSIARV